ncbi:uncharacterized protein OGAPODRAFT_92813 [Ogataea polymorpha]|uniref:uncharacterized protein n=1 Tax=Ogataea polymorpha TaxID=460523 RepID=UPI0007F424FF|nr:uncharacterized protein OGAPODRAFT_92813 [Ogataea polymorpha]OBA17544.1 hypothetical protein OGAPODRAFT_92813 [Ogataea polymorpha]
MCFIRPVSHLPTVENTHLFQNYQLTMPQDCLGDDAVLFYGHENWRAQLYVNFDTDTNRVKLPFSNLRSLDRHECTLTGTNPPSTVLDMWLFVLNECLLCYIPAADLIFEIPYEAITLVGLRGSRIYLNIIEGSDLGQAPIECELWPEEDASKYPLFSAFSGFTIEQHLQTALRAINERIAATSTYHNFDSEELHEEPADVEVHLNDQGEADDELNDQLLPLDTAKSSMYVELGIMSGKRAREEEDTTNGVKTKIR